MAMPSREDDIETIGGHVDVVLDYCGTFTNDPPDDIGGDFSDALASWCYVAGYANGRGLTTKELVMSLGLLRRDCECDVGGVKCGYLHIDNSRDEPRLGKHGQHIESCDTCGALDDDEAIAAHQDECGCGWGDRLLPACPKCGGELVERERRLHGVRLRLPHRDLLVEESQEAGVRNRTAVIVSLVLVLASIGFLAGIVSTMSTH